MLKRYQAGQNKWVAVTDQPQTARILQQNMPVIGITGPSPEYSLWSGVSYLVWNEEDLEDSYIRRVWSRYHGEAFVLLKEKETNHNGNAGWMIREMKKEDLPELKKLYQDEQAKQFLAHPTGGDETDQAWEEWLEAYQREIYAADGPAMWTLALPDGTLIGRIGFEWQKTAKTEGYFLGYALIPEKRGQGYISRAAEKLITCAAEWWELETVYLACHKTNQASAACAERLKFHFIYEDNDLLIFARTLSE